LKHNHQKGDKKGRPKNPKDEQPVGTKKKGREIVPLMVGSYEKYSVSEK